MSAVNNTAFGVAIHNFHWVECIHKFTWFGYFHVTAFLNEKYPIPIEMQRSFGIAFASYVQAWCDVCVRDLLLKWIIPKLILNFSGVCLDENRYEQIKLERTVFVIIEHFTIYIKPF